MSALDRLLEVARRMDWSVVVMPMGEHGVAVVALSQSVVQWDYSWLPVLPERRPVAERGRIEARLVGDVGEIAMAPTMEKAAAEVLEALDRRAARDGAMSGSMQR